MLYGNSEWWTRENILGVENYILMDKKLGVVLE
jgi:hypothetical protein